MAVTVTAAISPARDSGNSVCQISCQVLPPIDQLASTRPCSTSRSAVSTSRAKNGAQPATSGGMVPSTPSEVPVSNVVNGIITMSKMMNGRERSTLTHNDNRR
ncbi:hypothetical protein SB00610_02978 [Klebsiella quasipneumoniae subsp. similipneumoniae]|nr:hypothetical protein SB00610_02978 [Klebsiella quasipneumoniae subsp. similipneumoniae]